jgi:CheY-like chemotaxis protein
MKVLIVDDLVDTTEAMGMLFRMDGHEAAEAQSALRALRIGKTWRPDAVLIDLQMPGMNGFDLCRAIRRDAPWVEVVIAISGLTGDGVRRACEDAGFDAYLLKPTPYEEVVALLSDLLTRVRTSNA